MAKAEAHPLTRTLPWVALALGAVLVDYVIAPHLLSGLGRRYLTLATSVAVTILCGMRKGPFRGLALGWMIAVMTWGLVREPLGFLMLTHGLIGFASGLTRGVTQLRFVVFDLFLFAGLFAAQTFVSALAATMVLDAPFHPGIPGRILTFFFFAPYILKHPIAGKKSSAITRPDAPKGLKKAPEKTPEKPSRRSKGIFADAPE